MVVKHEGQRSEQSCYLARKSLTISLEVFLAFCSSMLSDLWSMSALSLACSSLTSSSLFFCRSELFQAIKKAGISSFKKESKLNASPASFNGDSLAASVKVSFVSLLDTGLFDLLGDDLLRYTSAKPA